MKLSSVFRGILGLVLHILRSKWRNEVRAKSREGECLLDSSKLYLHSVQRLMATRLHEDTTHTSFVGWDLGLLPRYFEVDS